MEEQTENKKMKEAMEEAARLLDRKSLVLGSAEPSGEPHASYAPFVRDEAGHLYVYLSELAKHFHTLKESGRASVLFIEDEADAGNIFARKRLTVQCRVSLVERAQAETAGLFSLFTAKFGAFFGHLQGMQDFHLFRLSPEGATLVTGFGSAFRIRDGQFKDIAWLRGEHGKVGAGLASP